MLTNQKIYFLYQKKNAFFVTTKITITMITIIVITVLIITIIMIMK